MKISITLLCIAILVSAIACNSSSKAPNGMTADEILARCQNASRTINTMQVHSIITSIDQGSSSNLSVSVDNSNRSLYMSENGSIPLAISPKLYILNNWVYTCNLTSNWVKTQLTEFVWDSFSSPTHLDILQNCIKASYIGMESVDGTNCYKMDITPCLESEINRLGLSQFGNSSIKSCSGAILIAENTYYPVKLSSNMTWTDGYRLSKIVTYSNINQPVNITLPAEAQNATVESSIW